MEVKIVRGKDEVTAYLIGRLDTPASLGIAPEISALAADAGGTVVLDCTDLAYISSSGLRIFITLRKEAAAKGGRIIVRNISNEIRSVFMMTGFLNLFEIQ